MMKKYFPMALLAGSFVFIPLGASAQSTYTTTNGEVNLVAGLTNLTSVTAINTTNQSLGIDYITDGSWSETGILNLSTQNPTNGILAGNFGGGTFYGTNNGIILIGFGPPTPSWGSWTIRLLLSDDTYSSSISFTNADLVYNPSITLGSSTQMLDNFNGSIVSIPALATYYQELNIAVFDTNNIGFKGIELSNMGANYPDITYIGVTSVVPEPSTYALLALSAAGLGSYVLRRRRK